MKNKAWILPLLLLCAVLGSLFLMWELLFSPALIVEPPPVIEMPTPTLPVLPPAPPPDPPVVADPVVMDRFLELYEQNNDLVGWVQVPGTNIDYPVVYCSDNAFYLKHNFDREYSPSGIPFLDKDANLLTSNQSLSLYGHHRRNGTMFSALHKYKKLSHYQQYPTFVFDSLYEEGTYKIFSVFYMAGNQSDKQFYYYPVSNFPDEAAFMAHVAQLQKRSIFQTDIDVAPGDQLVLLTCCTYEVDNLRLIVAGRKVRPGEDATVSTENVTLNPAPLYPQKWYDTLGGKPPA